MAIDSRDDILLLGDPPEARDRPLRVRVAAYVPITIALIGVAAILAGGITAGPRSTATVPAADPIATGSIGR